MVMLLVPGKKIKLEKKKNQLQGGNNLLDCITASHDYFQALDFFLLVTR